MALPIYQPQLHEAALPGPRMSGNSAETYGYSIGRGLEHFGVRLEAKLNEFEDAETLEMMNGFQREMDEYHMDPNKGILNTHTGKFAVGMADTALSHMESKAAEYRGRLGSWRAQQNFDRMANGYIDSRNKGNMNFEAQNVQQYQLNEANASIERNFQNIERAFDDDELFERSFSEIQQALFVQSVTQGWGNEVYLQKLQEYRDQAIARRYMAWHDKNYQTANDMLDPTWRERVPQIKDASGYRGMYQGSKTNISFNYVGKSADFTQQVEKNLSQWDEHIVRISQKYGIQPNIIRALMRKESSGVHTGKNGITKSPKGAIGLMQLMPGTARALGVDPYDPIQNIEGGVRYLKQMLDRFGSIELALAAYNGGPGHLENMGRDISRMWPETQDFVKKITAWAREYDSRTPQPQPVPNADVTSGDTTEQATPTPNAPAPVGDDVRPKTDANGVQIAIEETVSGGYPNEPVFKDPGRNKPTGGLIDEMSPQMRAKVEQIIEADIANGIARDMMNDPRFNSAIGKPRGLEAIRASIQDYSLAEAVEKSYSNAWGNKMLAIQLQEQQTHAAQSEMYNSLQYQLASGKGGITFDMVDGLVNSGQISKGQGVALMHTLTSLAQQQAKADAAAYTMDNLKKSYKDDPNFLSLTSEQQEALLLRDYAALRGLSFNDVEGRAIADLTSALLNGTLTGDMIKAKKGNYEISSATAQYYEDKLGDLKAIGEDVSKGILSEWGREFDVNKNSVGSFFEAIGLDSKNVPQNVIDMVKKNKTDLISRMGEVGRTKMPLEAKNKRILELSEQAIDKTRKEVFNIMSMNVPDEMGWTRRIDADAMRYNLEASMPDAWSLTNEISRFLGITPWAVDPWGREVPYGAPPKQEVYHEQVPTDYGRYIQEGQRTLDELQDRYDSAIRSITPPVAPRTQFTQASVAQMVARGGENIVRDNFYNTPGSPEKGDILVYDANTPVYAVFDNMKAVNLDGNSIMMTADIPAGNGNTPYNVKIVYENVAPTFRYDETLNSVTTARDVPIAMAKQSNGEDKAYVNVKAYINDQPRNLIDVMDLFGLTNTFNTFDMATKMTDEQISFLAKTDPERAMQIAQMRMMLLNGGIQR